MNSNNELIIKAQSGDIRAFEMLVDNFRDMAIGYAYSILKDYQYAEDVAQDAFFQAYFKLNALQSVEAFPSWFRRIVFSQCEHFYRKKRLPVVPLDDVLETQNREQSPAEIVEEKTLVTNAKDGARFLGFDVRAREQSNLTRKTKRGCSARNYGGHIVLEVPTDLIQKKLLELGAMKINVANGAEIWKSTHRSKLVCREDWAILEQYNGEIRGFCNFYSIANNRSKLHKFRCVMEYSLYKTLACKYRTSKKKIIDKYRHGKDFGIPYQDKHGNDKVRLLWKGSLAKDSFPKESSVDLIRKPKGILRKPVLGHRLTAGRCEWCGMETQDLVVHQVKSLKNLDDSQPWAAHMKKINRRTLVLCKPCHSSIHNAD